MKKLSRRDFLRLAAATATGALAAACAPGTPQVVEVEKEVPVEKVVVQTVEVEKAVKETVVVEKAVKETVVVEKVVTPTPGGLVGGAVADTYEAGQAGYGWYDEWHPSYPVEILAWGPLGGGSPWSQAHMARFKRFEKRYPNIKIIQEELPWGDYDTKVNAAMMSKQGPDLIFEADREGEFPRRGVNQVIPEETLGSSWVREHNFYEVRPLDDGKLYWIHAVAMGPIIYYNKDIFDKFGYKGEDIPKTWDEFARFAQELTVWEGDKMVQAGFAFNGYARYIWNDMIYQQESHCYSKEKALFNSPESERAWQTLSDFYDKYKINSREFLNFDEAFGTGKAAMTQVWTWFGNHLAENFPDVNYRPALYPTFDGDGPYGRFDYDGPGWMVTTLAKGDKARAAWEFFKFEYHEYQGLVEASHPVGFVVTARPHPNYERLFAELSAVEEPTREQLLLMQLAVLSKQFEGGMVFPGEVAGPFDGMWNKMEGAILYEQKPIKEVLITYEKEYTDMLQKTNFWVTPEA